MKATKGRLSDEAVRVFGRVRTTSFTDEEQLYLKYVAQVILLNFSNDLATTQLRCASSESEAHARGLLLAVLGAMPSRPSYREPTPKTRKPAATRSGSRGG